MRHATYIGPIKSLQGKTAMITLETLPEKVAVQLDDRRLPGAYRWDFYPAKHWVIVRNKQLVKRPK